MESNFSQKNIEYSNIRPPFPPIITAQDLVPAEVSNKVETVRIPNAFIAYRMALVRELKSRKVAYHRSNVSSLASRLWAEEPKDVKNTYKKISADAQILYNQARGLTFLSYEQSTSTDKIMQDQPNSGIINNHHPSAQNIEAELLVLLNLQIQTLQRNQMLTSSMYFNSNNNTFFSPSDQFNNFGGNMGVYGTERNLGHMEQFEQYVQTAEQQMVLLYQLWFGNYNVV